MSIQNTAFILITALTSSSCPGLVKIDSLCVMEPTKNQCWINKEQNKGIAIKDMEGYFSMNDDDLRKIIKKLNECDGKEYSQEQMDTNINEVLELKADEADDTYNDRQYEK